MVSSTLTTIVTTTGTSNQHRYQPLPQQPQQQQTPHPTTSTRNYYFSTTGDLKTTSKSGSGRGATNNLTSSSPPSSSSSTTVAIPLTSGDQNTEQSSPTSPGLQNVYTSVIEVGASTSTTSTGNTEISGTSPSSSAPVNDSSTLNSFAVTTPSKTTGKSFDYNHGTNKNRNDEANIAGGTEIYASNNITNCTGSSPPLSDQISILFPKCRPKSDFSLNNVNNNIINNSGSGSGSTNATIAALPNNSPSSSLSSESLSSTVTTPRISTNPFVNINSNHQAQLSSERYPPVCSYYYHSSGLKESQAHYSDMPRKRNYHVSGGAGICGNTSNNQNPFIKDNYWETRHNTTPASTVLNSPELTESESRSRFMQNQHQHVKVGRSPVSHPPSSKSYGPLDLIDKSAAITTTVSGRNYGDGDDERDASAPAGGAAGLAVVADGENAVFNDITENWQNLRVSCEQSTSVIKTPSGNTPNDDSLDVTAITPTLTCYADVNFRETKKTLLDRNYGLSYNGNRHGIMEYDGSPRRIGQASPEEDHAIYVQRHTHHLQKPRNISPPIYAARPGFPQRIITTTHESPPPLKESKKIQLTSTAEDTSNDVSEIGTSSDLTTSEPPKSSTFDYLYEFSETRKVLEEFFKCPSQDEKPIENGSDVDSIDIHYEFRENLDKDLNDYIGQRLAGSPTQDYQRQEIEKQRQNGYNSMLHHDNNTNDVEHHDIDFFLESASRSSGEQMENQDDGINQNRIQARNFRYSPETTDYDSNCGDLDSLSGEFNGISSVHTNYAKYYAASMPVLEDGLSSGHVSDTENNNPPNWGGISMLMDVRRTTPENLPDHKIPSPTIDAFCKNNSPTENSKDNSSRDSDRLQRDGENKPDSFAGGQSPNSKNKVFKNIDPDLDSLYSISIFHRPDMIQLTPPPPAPAPHRKPNIISATVNSQEFQHQTTLSDINNTTTALKDPRPTTLQRTKTSSISSNMNTVHDKPRQMSSSSPPPLPERIKTSPMLSSPVWIPRHLDTSTACSTESDHPSNKNLSADEDDVDTDLETDRLLGHQRLDDQGFYDENKSWDRKPRSLLATSLSKFSPKIQQTKSTGSSLLRQGLNSLLPTTPEVVPAQQSTLQQAIPQPVASPSVPLKNSANKLLDIGGSISSPDHSDHSPEKIHEVQQHNICSIESPGSSSKSKKDSEKKGINKKGKNKEVLIEGVLFRARYLGSTQLVCEGQPTKSTRMMQAEEAVSRIKAPDGEAQPSTEVDLFISTEKIMVLNTDLKEIMMDHALRTISYIADIGDLVVLMARRRFVPQDIDDGPKPNRTPKMICHVFESDEAQFIAQSIGQAFQVAYMEFLKANGIEDHSFVKEMDYQEVLNSQEIFGDELEIFAKKELQKEVVVPKAKGEILGVVIVESGWGSMLPTVVIANLMSSGAAARCGQLNIGDQLIAINGLSLVGLPLSTCQTYIKNTKNQTVVKFTVVPCAPVVEVKIKRPNTKYQLGFSVQNGVICSLLRGGIAERGGVRVGHRIIEINNQSVVAVPHEKIVNLLATSVGEILMKTMPTSMFRLLTGQENPIYI